MSYLNFNKYSNYLKNDVERKSDGTFQIRNVNR